MRKSVNNIKGKVVSPAHNEQQQVIITSRHLPHDSSSSGSATSTTVESRNEVSTVTNNNANDVGSRTSSIFAQSILEKIIRSWALIEQNKVKVGMDFFVRVFTNEPNLLRLFSFGPELAGRPELLRDSPLLRIHVVNVMNFIGRGVQGLNDIDSLIPDLRSIGKVHVRVGVSATHYDMFFRHLMAAFAKELGGQWDQDTADAWANVYRGMTAVMDQPEMLNETEPLQGFGLCLAASYAYISFISPLRLAGFLVPLPYVTIQCLDCLELLAVFFLLVDLISPSIVRIIKIENGPQRRMRLRFQWQTRIKEALFPLSFRLYRALFSLHLERWISWRRLDMVIVSSYILQNLQKLALLNVHLIAPSQLTLYATDVGVSWLHITGLLRVSAMWRVMYFARCWENAAILKHSTTEEWRRRVVIAKLLVTLLYVTHVSACLWCIIARVELGVGVIEAVASDFFPDTSILFGKSGLLTAYLRSIYWAWANLAGTGNVDSTPVLPLEICSALLVHLCGASLYAIVTGHVVSILEQMTEKENHIGNDLAELRAFMDECRMPSEVQDRIMRGYLTQHVMKSESDLTIPDLREEVGRRLPSHFRLDLQLHARAVALQRRNQVFNNCSNDFLFALSSGLRSTVKLLAGDFLVEVGVVITRRLCVIEKGCLELIKDGESLTTFERGCAIGVGWLVDATKPPKSKLSFKEPCEFSDWLWKDGTAAVSIRATTDCIVATGLPSPLEIEALQRRFPHDIAILESAMQKFLESVENREHTGVSYISRLRSSSVDSLDSFHRPERRSSRKFRNKHL